MGPSAVHRRQRRNGRQRRRHTPSAGGEGPRRVRAASQHAVGVLNRSSEPSGGRQQRDGARHEGWRGRYRRRGRRATVGRRRRWVGPWFEATQIWLHQAAQPGLGSRVEPGLRVRVGGAGIASTASYARRRRTFGWSLGSAFSARMAFEAPPDRATRRALARSSCTT